MKLLTKELLARFKEVGSQEKVKDPIIIAKFFYPAGSATWYATEYDPETRVFFGYVSLFNDHNDEWGYFSLDELEEFESKTYGIHIERDRFFEEQPSSNIIYNHYWTQG